LVTGAAQVLACGIALLWAQPAEATPWVHRNLTLSRGTWEVGLGLGLKRVPDNVGVGFNLELGVGLTSAFELRVRTGLRVGTDGRTLGADYFGRPFETETYNLGDDTLANPEIGIKWAFVRRGAVELGLDFRMILPVGSNLGLLFGLPLKLELGVARIDSGVFVPIVFNEGDDYTAISIPLHIFFAVGGGTYFGPLTGIVFEDGGDERVPLGLGIGSGIASGVDLRFWFLFPDISESGSAKIFGAGVALYILF
jgi:hypothetical protein